MKYIFNLLFITIVILLIFVIYKNIELTKDNKIKPKEMNITKIDKNRTITIKIGKEKNLTTTKVAKKDEINKTTTKITKKEQIDITKAKRDILSKRLKALKSNLGDPIFLRIFKKSKELEVWIKPKKSKKYKLLKVYKICYYSGGLGPKLKEGDGKSPEGFYSVKYKALNPHSHYHLSFNLGFPNRYDRNHKRTGSYLMVHGDCVSIGCYALGNKNIEDVYKLVESYLKKSNKKVWVHIFPFRLEQKELYKYRKNRWYKFWKNLKEGYDKFNKTHIPPTIKVKGLKYIII